MLEALLTRKGHRPFKPRRRFDEPIGCPIGFTYYIIYRGAKNIPFLRKTTISTTWSRSNIWRFWTVSAKTPPDAKRPPVLCLYRGRFYAYFAPAWLPRPEQCLWRPYLLMPSEDRNSIKEKIKVTNPFTRSFFFPAVPYFLWIAFFVGIAQTIPKIKHQMIYPSINCPVTCPNKLTKSIIRIWYG